MRFTVQSAIIDATEGGQLHPDYLKQFNIAVDSDDYLDLSFAVAARGVLEAVAPSTDILTSPDLWSQAIVTATQSGELTAWKLPSSELRGHRSAIAPLSALRLSQAWRDAVVDSNVGARLALQPTSNNAWPRWFPFSGGSPGKLTAERRDARTLMRGDIASVVLATALPSQGERGAWPIHIGIFPSERSNDTAAALRAVSMVRRDLAKVSILSANSPKCDLLIAPFALREIRRRALSYGFTPSAGIVVAPFDGLRNQAQRAYALNYLNSDVGASVVATGMPFDGLEGPWVNELIRSLSHNSALDIAMWEADRHVRRALDPNASSKVRHPTIIADSDFLLNSTLDRHVLNLADRIQRLDRPLDFDLATASRLGFRPGMSSYSVAAALREKASDISYLRESEGATDISEVSQTVAAAEAAPSENDVVDDSSDRAPLYADVAFSDSKRQVDDTVEALQIDREYDFKVALRHVPTGVSHRGKPSPKPVALTPSKEDISLLVVINAREEDFDIPEQVKRIVVPAGIDSESDVAIFRVTPKRHTLSDLDLVSIEVRIYYELNLLEFLDVRAEVVSSRFSSTPQLSLPVPIFVEQRSNATGSSVKLVTGVQPCQMGIDIRRVGDMARFTFTFLWGTSGSQQSLVMQARSSISLSALGLELNRLRRIWQEIAVGSVGNALQMSASTFKSTIHQLAMAGRDISSLLFRGKQDSSLWIVGKWLQDYKLITGSLIDVRFFDGAAGFVFPWSMLYDLPISDSTSDSTVDPKGFWGLRYSIAQRVSGWPDQNDVPFAADVSKSTLRFMVWDSFPNVSQQTALLSSLVAASNGRLNVPEPPIDSRKSFYDMIRHCDADILYFYTHGYTRPAEADGGYSLVDEVKKRYDAMSDPERAASGLKPIYDLIAAPDFKPDQSWIGLSNGKLFLRDLRAEEVNLLRRPIVFLNMCQSAQIMPGLTDSFVSFFLERRARSVLGTECPMTTAFAHPFSERLLREFMAGEQLGEALRRARCHFIDQKNPLGLAYSLFGSATVRYDPAIVS